MIGKYYPGLTYDINTWQNNPSCGVYPCTEQYQEKKRVKDKEGLVRRTIQKRNIDIYLIVTPHNILVLRLDPRTKNTGKLHAWASLHAIEKVKHGLDDPEQVTIQMRQFDKEREPWVLSLRMRN